MSKFLKPFLFISCIVSTLVFSTGCKKCIICTVKDLNSGKVLYISPEKCGSESDFSTLKDSVDKAYYCWGCAIYDSLAYDTIAGLTDALRLDSAYIMSLDSFKVEFAIDTLDSIKCGSVAKLVKLKNHTTNLVRVFLIDHPSAHLRCFSDGFPVKTECD